MQISKPHAAVVAALLALAAVVGAVAVARTTGLGTASRHASDAAVAAKERQLSAYARRLDAALAAATKPLPKAAPAQAAPQQRVVYHRPPPVVVVSHTRHGDDGHESEGGGDD